MNDTAPPGSTTGTSSTQSPPPPYGEGPRATRDEIRDLARLRRSTSERKIAGVAGGIARHLDIDPVVVRIALVVLVFFGGGGILLYAVAWLLVPDDRGDSVVRLDDRSRTVALAIVGALTALSLVGDAFGGWEFPWPLAVAGVVVVVVLATGKHHKLHEHAQRHGWTGAGGWHGGPADAPLVGEDGEPLPDDGRAAAHAGTTGHPGYGQPWQPRPRDPRKKGPILFGFTFGLAALAVGIVATVDLAGAAVTPSAYSAVVMAVFGLMLVVGAFYGRAGGLVFFGLIAAASTGIASLAGPLDGTSFGQINRTPQTAAQLESDYSLVAGEIIIDLTEVEDPENLEALDVDLKFGHIEVIVPEEGLDVNAYAGIQGAGEVRLFGDKFTDDAEGSHDGGEGVPSIDIEADLVLGEIEFTMEDAA